MAINMGLGQGTSAFGTTQRPRGGRALSPSVLGVQKPPAGWLSADGPSILSDVVAVGDATPPPRPAAPGQPSTKDTRSKLVRVGALIVMSLAYMYGVPRSQVNAALAYMLAIARRMSTDPEQITFTSTESGLVTDNVVVLADTTTTAPIKFSASGAPVWLTSLCIAVDTTGADANTVVAVEIEGLGPNPHKVICGAGVTELLDDTLQASGVLIDASVSFTLTGATASALAPVTVLLAGVSRFPGGEVS